MTRSWTGGGTATFFILVAWVALSAYLPSGSAAAAANGVAAVLTVFGVVAGLRPDDHPGLSDLGF